jgi:hypothetical protein
MSLINSFFSLIITGILHCLVKDLLKNIPHASILKAATTLLPFRLHPHDMMMNIKVYITHF